MVRTVSIPALGLVLGCHAVVPRDRPPVSPVIPGVPQTGAPYEADVAEKTEPANSEHQEPEKSAEVPRQGPVTTSPEWQQAAARQGDSSRDYSLRVGIGFRPEELVVLERAASTWRAATGLPLHLRQGYGPTGAFHLSEHVPVCGQRWVYDGYLGCYEPDADLVVLNRPGIELEAAHTEDLLYIVLLHEIGHWLGLPHAKAGSDSIMVEDLMRLNVRGAARAQLSQEDVKLACELNTCGHLDAESSSGR